MDQLAERPVVDAVTVRRVETERSCPAKGATALFIQGVAVQEGRAAGYAKMFGQERLRTPQALLTDREA
jgi:hypothetical protein